MSIATLVDQARDERLLGASEASAALGVSKYRSPMDVWRRKVAARRGEPVPRETNEPMEWGVALEPLVRAKYALIRGVHVIVPTASLDPEPLGRRGTTMLGDPWIRCTPDGIVFEGPPPGASVDYTSALVALLGRVIEEHPRELDAQFPNWRDEAGLLEVKTTGAHNAELWSEGVPEEYEIQVRVQMAVADVDWCDVVCLIGGQRLVGPFRIERNVTREVAILTDLRRFWRLVESETPPDVDGSPAWAEYASRQLTRSAGAAKLRTVIEADPEVRAHLADWRIARIERKRAELQEAESKTQLLMKLAAAGATGIDGGDLGKVTAYRPGGRMDWKAYAEHIERAFLKGTTAAERDAMRTMLDEAKDRYRGEPGEWTLRAPATWGKE